MAADFPTSPTLNQTYTFGGRTWTWNGTGWALVANSISTLALSGATSGAVTLQAAAVAGTNTVTFPATTGTVVTTGDSGTVTSAMIADGTIVNGDVSASAAIAGSKIAPDFGAQDITTSGNVLLTGTGYVDLPAGTTAQRPGTPNSGMVRYNSTLGIFEGYGSSWKRLDNAATGGGSDDIFYENGQTVTTNYTLTSGKNAMSAGPITINNSVVVTIPSGASWVII